MKHGVNYVMALRHQGLNYLSNLSCFKYLDIFKKNYNHQHLNFGNDFLSKILTFSI